MQISTSDLVVFQDKQGNIHDVFGARTMRVDGARYLILSEKYLGFELRIDKPTQELTDQLNTFNDEYFKKKYGYK